jgi:hypothetical protein
VVSETGKEEEGAEDPPLVHSCIPNSVELNIPREGKRVKPKLYNNTLRCYLSCTVAMDPLGLDPAP